MSSKTRKASSKNATASALNYLRLVLSLTVLFVVLAVWFFQDIRFHSLSLGGQEFRVEFADTPSAQEKGLGGRDRLSADHGMLFRFAEPSDYCFWMKDMRFNLDIIWFDASKKINHIESNLSPSSYPKNYCPEESAKYVLEVNSGTAAKLNLKIGDSISF